MASPVSSCSTDFDASEVFAEALMDQINREDVRNMVQTQKDMLSRFEKTNEMLINFNILSANRCAATSLEFKKHTQLLYEMKRDLDTVFKRIRTVKERLGKVYPDAFKACGNVAPLLEEEEGEEEESISSSQSSQSLTESKSSRLSQSGEDQQTETQKPTNKQTASTSSSESDKAQSSKSQKQSASSGTVPKTRRPNSGKESKSKKTSLKSTKSNISDDKS